MTTLQFTRNAAQPDDAAQPPNGQPSFLNAAGFTFAGLAAVGSILMPFLATLMGTSLPNLYLAVGVAVVLGGAVMINEFISSTTRPPKDQVFATVFVGLINIAILATTYLGVSAVAHGEVVGAT